MYLVYMHSPMRPTQLIRRTPSKTDSPNPPSSASPQGVRRRAILMVGRSDPRVRDDSMFLPLCGNGLSGHAVGWSGGRGGE